jgi:hypothetical protein
VSTRKKSVKVDATFHNHGSIVMCEPHTDEARTWVDEHVQLEDWQWMGGRFAVEPRMVEDLAQGMMDDGLVVKGGA